MYSEFASLKLERDSCRPQICRELIRAGELDRLHAQNTCHLDIHWSVVDEQALFGQVPVWLPGQRTLALLDMWRISVQSLSHLTQERAS